MHLLLWFKLANVAHRNSRATKSPKLVAQTDREREREKNMRGSTVIHRESEGSPDFVVPTLLVVSAVNLVVLGFYCCSCSN